MTADIETKVVPGPGGRELCLELAGDPAGPTILVHGGTPNSRHLSPDWISEAERRNLRLVSYDRPGYGRSSPDPGHSVADAAGDVRAIAQAIGCRRMATWGYSGGGPYALACAALLPELTAAAATVGSIAPYGAPGLDYLAGTGDLNAEDIRLYFSDPEAARTKAAADREELLHATAEDVAAGLATLLSPADAAVLTGAFAEFMVRCSQDGLAPGDQGWWDDGVAHLSPWGFEIASIPVPVKVWHGAQDRFVPFSHGEWLAAHVPGAEAELSQVDGHLTLLVSKVGGVMDWLLERL
ncbi:MAG: alpha/beta fold hydrolase [Candidatus Dormibacteria bacterium]